MTSENHKRKCISLATKAALIEEVDKKIKTKAQICREYDIASSSLHTILNNRTSIMAAVTSGEFMQDRKKIRKSDYEAVDRTLLAWFKQARSKNIPVSGPILLEKGKELADSLGINDFCMSNGWLARFKTRHGIAMKTVCGEAASVSTEMTDKWTNEDLQSILREYEPRDIFNADETGLFYKCLPNRTLAEKGEVCSGGKVPKDRLSLLIAANMDGSEKLPLLAIGKFERPRCLKNLKTLPTEYKSNKKAWMTAAIFEQWVRKLDRRFLIQGRSIALVLDNCSAHPKLSDLKAVKLFFLPANTTSVLQPCDQGIIKTFKTLYRKKVLKKLLTAVENHGGVDSHLKMNVLDALCMASAAWDGVKADTIAKCFRHAGFVYTTSASDTDVTEPASSVAGVDHMEVDNLFERLKDIMPVPVTVEEYLAVDEHVSATEEFSTDDFVRLVREENSETVEEEEEDKEDEDGADTTAPISTKTAFEALNNLKLFFMQQENSTATLQRLGSIESVLEEAALKAKRQTTMYNFFKPTQKPA